MKHHDSPQSEHRYRGRFLSALAGVLGVLVVVIRFWPAPAPSSPGSLFNDRASERIQIREIQPTSQTRDLTPPPPAPVPPIVVPNNVPIKEKIEFDDGVLAVEDPGNDDRLQEGTTDAPTAARQPDTNPRLFRAVQPEYPSAAQEHRVRARIEVAVEVSKTGQVKDATIVKRWRLSADGRAEPVSHLEYGLEEAALGAAHRSQFRPAEHNGTPVASQTTITFEFGPPSN